MTHKNLILLAIIIGLTMAMLGSIYDPNLTLFAQESSKERGERIRALDVMDRELKHVDEKFQEIKQGMKEINQKIDSICDDVNNMKIKAAESGGIYGGGSALIIYFIGMLGKSFWANRKRK